MPELPEIETLARHLRHRLVGRRIVGVAVREHRLRHVVSRNLAVRLRGHVIRHVSRRGKFLVLGLDGDEALIVHLGMSGTLRFGAAPRDVRGHDHIAIDLDDGRCLIYNDPRRFGMVSVRRTDGKALCRLGVDPLSAEFTAQALRKLTRRRRRPIKNLLMDQAVVAGVGNIYANEILAVAGIRPGRAAGRLTRIEQDAVVRAARRVLREAIRRGGSSIADFRDAAGRRGRFQEHFRVYGRADRPCRRCGTPIRGGRLAGRATFHCPSCQH